MARRRREPEPTKHAQTQTRSLEPVTPAGTPVKSAPRKPDPSDHTSQTPVQPGISNRGILGWTVDSAKIALASHMGGQFGASGLLSDAFWSHPIIRKCRSERNEVLSKLPRIVSPRRKRDKQAAYAADWFKEYRDAIFPDYVLRQWHDDEMQMGQFISGMDWEERRDGRHRWWLPVHKPWHPSQTQYFYRGVGRSVDGGVFHATTLNKGLLVVEPGMGRWVLGQVAARQPWLQGLVFSLGNDFIGDGYNFFDNLAYQERFGLGFMQYFHRDDYNRPQVNASVGSIQGAGAGAVIPMRLGSDGQKQEYLEMVATASGSGASAFDQTEARILRRICLAYLGQDMTSVGQTGGFAQAKVQGGVRWEKFEESASWFFDARMERERDPETGYERVIWEPCDGVLYNQVSKWVGWYNFGSWDCMPHYYLDASPPAVQAEREERQSKNAVERSRAIQALAAALPQLIAAMPEVQAREWFEQAGVLSQLGDRKPTKKQAKVTAESEEEPEAAEVTEDAKGDEAADEGEA